MALAAIGGLCASAAAMPMSPVPGHASLLQNAAVVCNARGRCWHEERRFYRDRDEDVYVGPRYRHYDGPGLRFGFGDRWR